MAQSKDIASESPSSRVPRGKIESAMEEVAGYRRDLMRAIQIGAGTDERFLRGFHAAVMNYYEELRVYRDWPAVEDEWNTMRMWPVEADASIGVGYLMRDQHVEVVEDEDGEQSARLTAAGQQVVLDDEWIRGVDAIESWMDRTRVVEVAPAGRTRSKKPEAEPAYMPPRILIAASRALDTVARELGASIKKADDKSLPAITGFDQSSEKPAADVTTAEYNRSPDL